jgi:hypothetical protein
MCISKLEIPYQPLSVKLEHIYLSGLLSYCTLPIDMCRGCWVYLFDFNLAFLTSILKMSSDFVSSNYPLYLVKIIVNLKETMHIREEKKPAMHGQLSHY